MRQRSAGRLQGVPAGTPNVPAPSRRTPLPRDFTCVSGVARVLLRAPDMDAIEVQLAAAEFEEIWLEVRYHEGSATIGDVSRAIQWVNELRRLVEERAVGGPLPWPAPRETADAGH